MASLYNFVRLLYACWLLLPFADLMGLITPATNAGLPDRLFKRHGRWASEVAKNGNVQDSLSSRGFFGF